MHQLSPSRKVRKPWRALVAAIVFAASPALAPGARADGKEAAQNAASGDVAAMMEWIGLSGDNRRLPFAIVDKRNAKVLVFDGRGQFQGTAPVLLGLSKGDDSAAGIGTRKLADIGPDERTTPAGRFEAALGHDLKQDILWVDYATALSLHRVITGNPRDRRAQRLASRTSDDNRITYGCINVPAAFYDSVIIPTFAGTIGIVYILPETRTSAAVFAMPGRLAAGVRK